VRYGSQDVPAIPLSNRTERADAARNRVRVLEAAARLFAERGAEAVSMDDVAAAAGVGKGTLYRRFGDRAGLAMALLDSETRELQEAIVRGAPPLGPGAPPAERLLAFIGALADLTETHGPLLRDAERTWRFDSPVYRAWRAHVALLLEQARPDVVDPALADVVLAAMEPRLHHHLRATRGLSAGQVRQAAQAPARALLASP
jgi:AcrR family transcriptional regulator